MCYLAGANILEFKRGVLLAWSPDYWRRDTSWQVLGSQREGNDTSCASVGENSNLIQLLLPEEIPTSRLKKCWSEAHKTYNQTRSLQKALNSSSSF
jgi:hypothetical protein